MNVEEVMQALNDLSSERMKKIYMKNGAVEPLFGVATGAMKPLAKKVKGNQQLAEQLYETNNYDAMYFAGVIADPLKMTEQDFERWIEQAYFYMISEYIVAVTLAESPLGEQIALKWINAHSELKIAAGWSCYCWMLGNRKDETFDSKVLEGLLGVVKDTIHRQLPRVKLAMNLFVTTVTISFKPLHQHAFEVAKQIGRIDLYNDGKKILEPEQTIAKEIERNRIGFKRKYVRC